MRLFILFILLFIHSLCINYRVDRLTIDLCSEVKTSNTCQYLSIVYEKLLWIYYWKRYYRKGLKISLEKSILTSSNIFIAHPFVFILDLIAREEKILGSKCLEIKKKITFDRSTIWTRFHPRAVKNTFFSLTRLKILIRIDRTFLESFDSCFSSRCASCRLLKIFEDVTIARSIANTRKLVCSGNGVSKMRWQWIESGTIRHSHVAVVLSTQLA